MPESNAKKKECRYCGNPIEQDGNGKWIHVYTQKAPCLTTVATPKD
jgi:hypothetical protein